MSRYRRETEHHVGRRHCRTCVCQEVNQIRRISPIRMSPHRSPYTSVRHQEHCRNCCRPPLDDWEDRRVFRERFNVSPTRKVERKIHSDHKYSMLENWFKKFDFDGNGLIDVYELQKLLDYLGVKCDQEYVKELIEDSDRDHDGMLSFSDFLHMWSQAATEDGEDLTDVMREHDLYPDILPSIKHRKHKPSNRIPHGKEVRKHEPRHEYSCCEQHITKRKTGERDPAKLRDPEIKSKVKHLPTRYSDELPLLSCHR